MPIDRIELGLGNDQAIAALCRQLNVTGVDFWRGPFDNLFERASREGLPRNLNISLTSTHEQNDVSWHKGMGGEPRYLARGALLGARRTLGNHEYRGGWEQAPPLSVLEVPNGTVMRMAGIATIFAADSTNLMYDVSSNYAPLIHVYDFDASSRIAGARYHSGPVFVIMSDIGVSNYCHWLLDELPRIALLRDWPDAKIVIAEEYVPWRHEHFRLAGVPEASVLVLGPNEALRAETLLVPAARDIQHPAQKGAAWVIDWIRSRMGLPAAKLWLGKARNPLPKKIYLGRGDAATRRLRNEAALVRLLVLEGFESVTLSGRPAEEQVALFMAADTIIAMHGAGLSNIVFCAPATKVIEIFTPYHGTPAFGIVASACRLKYASYCAEPGQLAPDEGGDAVLDVPAFWRAADAWLSSESN